ncbi:hypothetical protein ACLBXO_11850 [Methylobacterium sp. C33D]
MNVSRIRDAMRYCDLLDVLDYSIAELRLGLAFIALDLLELKAGFRQDQPRGRDGCWCGGSGSLVVARKDKTGDPRIDGKTDAIVDVLGEVVQTCDPGQGPLYGIEVHTKFAARMRELDLPGIGRHGIEQSFSAGDLVRYGLDGSIRTDVILRDGRTNAAPIRAIWDIKTGKAQLTPARARELRRGVGVDDSVPVIEIHLRRGNSVKGVSISAVLFGERLP